MRQIAERIILIAMIGMSVVVAGADLLGLTDNQLHDRVPSIILIMLATITVFLLFELERLQLLEKMTEHLSQLDIEAAAKALFKKRYAGIYAVHSGFDNEKFKGMIKAPEVKTIRILQSWIPSFDGFSEELYQAICDGSQVEILVVHPRSQIAKLRGAAVAKAVDNEIRSNLTNLSSIYSRLPMHLRGNLRVKKYSALLSLAVYQVDDTFLISFFVQKKLAVNTLQLEVHGYGTEFALLAIEEFTNLWSDDVNNPLLSLEGQEWITDLYT